MNMPTILRALVAMSENGWVALALKATVAMLATLLVTRVAARASASLRHLVVAASFGVLLLLPAAAVLVPARVVRVPVLAVLPAAPAPAVSGNARLAADPTGTAPAVSSRPVSPKSVFHFDPRDLALGAWAAGAAALILSLLAGIWRVHRIRRGADVWVAGTRLANEMARASGRKGGIEVSVSAELAVPITFGSARPVILLPRASKEWSGEELARAIRHELEHIARHDWAMQIGSRLTCALYWPHPAVWVLWRRLRVEAERACDDAVVRGSESAEPYAEQLVALARDVMGRRAVPALAMASRSSLGVRVEAILDRRLPRAPLTRLGSLFAVAIAAVFMLGVAPFRLVSAVVEGVGGRADSVEAYGEADPLDRELLMAAERDDLQIMRLLLDRGAKANAVISGDGSPLIAAARQGHVEAMRLLIGAGADVNRGVEGDGNPLTNAASGGHLEAVRYLLENGAKVDEGIPGDGNALIMAAGAGRLEVVRYLLDRGAKIEKVVPGDENALIHASETGQAEVVRFLIGRGADVNARVWAEQGRGDGADGEWRTPLVMARRGRHEEVLTILRAAGAKE